jgi:hypothetical protein
MFRKLICPWARGHSESALSFRLVILGALLAAAGIFTFAAPGIFFSPSPVYDHTLFVQVAPSNYSYVQRTLFPQQMLQVTISSSPEGVDFFLMNSSSFSSWKSSNNDPAIVYPQSVLDARNYSFTATTHGSLANYTLVFVSRSSNMTTDVLLHFIVNQEASITETVWIPLGIIACGVVIATLGVTRRKKMARAD